MGERNNGEGSTVQINWGLLKLIEGGEAQVYDAEKLYRGKVLKLYEGWDPESVRFYTNLLKQSQDLVGGQTFKGRKLQIIVPEKQIMTAKGPATISEHVRGPQIQFDPDHSEYMGFLNGISLSLQQGLGNHEIVIVPKNAMLPPGRIAVTDIATQVRAAVGMR